MAYKAIIDVELKEEGVTLSRGDYYTPVSEKRTAELLGPFNALEKPVIAWVDDEPKVTKRKTTKKDETEKEA